MGSQTGLNIINKLIQNKHNLNCNNVSPLNGDPLSAMQN